MPDRVGLRERKKRQTRRSIAEAALRLFAERGFRAVTVADIAAAADVSPRTFFSYFPSKDDLLLVDADERVRQLVEAFRSRAANEPLLPVARALASEMAYATLELFRPPGVATDSGTETELARLHAMVLARLGSRWIGWEDELAEAVAVSRSASDGDPRPRVVAGAILAAVRAFVEIETRAGLAADPEAVLDAAFEPLEAGLGGYGAPLDLG